MSLLLLKSLIWLASLLFLALMRLFQHSDIDEDLLLLISLLILVFLRYWPFLCCGVLAVFSIHNVVWHSAVDTGGKRLKR